MLLGDRFIDVSSIVEELGITIKLRTNDWLVGLCPLHEDSRRSFAINKDHGGWVCYAACGKGGLVELYSRVLGISYGDAWTALLKRGDKVPGEALWNILLRGKSEPRKIDSADLFYDSYRSHRYLLTRGFTVETLKSFKVGWDDDLKAIVIPAFENGRLVGLIKRLINPGKESKYDYTYGWQKSHHVFALDRIRGNSVIVCEGALNAMWLHQFDLPGVAILGSSLHKVQRDKLLKKAYEVVLLFDNDESGRKGRREAEREFPMVTVKHAYVPSQFNDIQDVRDENVVREVIHKAKPLVKLTLQ